MTYIIKTRVLYNHIISDLLDIRGDLRAVRCKNMQIYVHSLCNELMGDVECRMYRSARDSARVVSTLIKSIRFQLYPLNRCGEAQNIYTHSRF